MSAASDVNGDESATQVDEVAPAAEPHIKVLRGNPTDAEIAALVAVLGTAGGAAAESGTQARNMWGHPVDKLRIPVLSWQLITMRERTHLRR